MSTANMVIMCMIVAFVLNFIITCAERYIRNNRFMIRFRLEKIVARLLGKRK